MKFNQGKNHFATGLQKFTKGQYLLSKLLMNTITKLDRNGIGYQAFRDNKAQPQNKPKPSSYSNHFYTFFITCINNFIRPLYVF